MKKDDFYDYSSFSNEKIKGIFEGWNGLGGYHGLLIKKCALLVVGHSVLDVGCGLCHLYEGFDRIKHLKSINDYVGIEKHPLVLEMARNRYPKLNLVKGNVYDLSEFGLFDTVYVIGLYREEPILKRGIIELFNHAKQCVVLTYFAKEMGKVPETLKIPNSSVEFIDHDIDDRLEIVRLWRT